ncbi:restriction endonuclease subunit S [Elizabethkingia ursingii]|nr:restriction endonuclease subunit S [Elizabethkingia ursingii]
MEGIANKIGDGLHGTPDYTDNSEYYFINGNNLVNGRIEIFDNTKKVSNHIFAKNNKDLKENTLLISINGTIGSIAKYNGENVMLGKSVGYFNFKNNSDFIYFTLHTRSIQDYFFSELTGSTIKNLSLKTLRETSIYLPSNEEQYKISCFFNLVEDRIQTQKKIISQLKSQMSNLKDLIFEQKLRLKNDNGIYFPSWKFFRLSDLGNTFNGLSGKTKEHFGSGQKYIQYKQIFDSAKINIADCAFVDIEENENQNIVKYGDVFFTISSETPEEIGMSSVLLEKVNNVYLNSFCFGFRSHSFDELIPEFSQFLFRSNGFRNEIVKLAQGSTRYNMSKIEFLKLKVKLPGKDEQIKIASFLSSIQEKIETEKQILEKLELQKKFLLGNLFV